MYSGDRGTSNPVLVSIPGQLFLRRKSGPSSSLWGEASIGDFCCQAITATPQESDVALLAQINQYDIFGFVMLDTGCHSEMLITLYNCLASLTSGNGYAWGRRVHTLVGPNACISFT